jgi:hypothetical protein
MLRENIVESAFWGGFLKSAGIMGTATSFFKKTAPKIEQAAAPATAAVAKPAVQAAAPKAVAAAPKPAPQAIDYAAMRSAEITKKRTPAGTLDYTGSPGNPTYYGAGKSPADSRLAAEAKLKEQAKKRIANALKATHTDPQFRRLNP